LVPDTLHVGAFTVHVVPEVMRLVRSAGVVTAEKRLIPMVDILCRFADREKSPGAHAKALITATDINS
jgi:hypothetical protein